MGLTLWGIVLYLFIYQANTLELTYEEKQMAKKKNCPTGQHAICVASDSKLAECVCWCAQCKEVMAEIRKAYKNNKQAIIQEIKEWA
jgi:hypothetical protein